MNLPKMNLHSHSRYSDGAGKIKHIVKRSVKIGLKYLAITDHLTDSWKAGIMPTLDSKQKIDRYLNEISRCRRELDRKKSSLKIYKGVEIDIGSSEKHILNLVDPRKFDIILWEYLETPESIGFVRKIIYRWTRSFKEKGNSPIFGLAHFNPSYFLHSGMELLIRFLKEFNIYFEFNTRYSDCFSTKNETFFGKLREEKIPVGVGSDTHNLGGLDRLKDPLSMVSYYNLEENYGLLISILNNNYNG
ncbi:MAG: PHP domain-containing protein [Candidatus Lokiarchaeota archaeon]|nr:PHP domain-containing protein [Candidatus Lokiarchaeota archaeon]MBD3340601.1 PHP domain-containing protein [Candidatus Lokiarchaeota archaeon]